MFVKTPCPHCGESAYSEISIRGLETTHFLNDQTVYSYRIEEIEVVESIKTEDVLKDLMLTLRHVKRKLDDKELTDMLIRLFGFSKSSVDEILPLIKAEMKANRKRVKHPL